MQLANEMKRDQSTLGAAQEVTTAFHPHQASQRSNLPFSFQEEKLKREKRLLSPSISETENIYLNKGHTANQR